MSDDYFQPSPRPGPDPTARPGTSGPSAQGLASRLNVQLTRVQAVVLGALLLLIGVTAFAASGSPTNPAAAAGATTADLMRTCESAGIAALGPEPSAYSGGTASDRIAALGANFDWKLALTDHRNACMESAGPFSCGLGECRTTDSSNETWVWNGKYKQ